MQLRFCVDADYMLRRLSVEFFT